MRVLRRLFPRLESFELDEAKALQPPNCAQEQPAENKYRRLKRPDGSKPARPHFVLVARSWLRAFFTHPSQLSC